MPLIPRWPWTMLFWMLLAATARTARAENMLVRVPTDAGVTVAVPSGLRRAAGLGALPNSVSEGGASEGGVSEGGAPRVEGLATFTDDDAHPLNIQIRKGAPHGFASLPAPSEGAAAEWTRGFAAELNLPEAYDFTPGQYAPERGAISLQYKVHGPSPARLMQMLPDSDPLWGPVVESGGDVELTKCLLGALLGGQLSATEAELRTQTAPAAQKCQMDSTAVAQYVGRLGLAEFAPSLTSVTCVSFLTQLGTIVVLITAPVDRQAAVDAATGVVWGGTEVDPSARLPVEAGPTKALDRGHLISVVIGAVLGVLVLGGTFSWLLVKVGVRPLLAVSSCLGVLVVLSVLGLIKSGLRLDAELQVGCYVLASALVFRPLTRWLSTRVRGSDAAASGKAT